jgi:hypothetical protein
MVVVSLPTIDCHHIDRYYSRLSPTSTETSAVGFYFSIAVSLLMVSRWAKKSNAGAHYKARAIAA